MSVILFILVLSLLVFIHELGHFIAAIRSGVEVEEFGIGYPPKAITLFTWRGTAFTLNWIPFGGFVRMKGEDGTVEGSSSDKKSAGSFQLAETWQKLFIILAGPGVNFFFGVLVFAGVFTYSGIPHLLTDARIGAVAPGSPAAQAALPTNVSIIGITADEVFIETPTVPEVIDVIVASRGKSVTVHTTGACEFTSCSTEGMEYSVYVRNQDQTPEGEGAIGVAFESVVFQFYPWWEMPFRAIVFGFQQAFELSMQIVAALGGMFSDLIKNQIVPDQVAGPIGIVHQAQQTGILTGGVLSLLSFAALLSVNLAVMNVLPIPPLDGGRAVLLVAEHFLGRKKTQRVEYYLNYGGYLLLLGLIISITVQDVIRIFN